MIDLYTQIIHENPEISAKFMQSFMKKFKKPDLEPDWLFVDKMKRRVNKKIQDKEQQQVNTVLEGLPSAIKWRFRVTGFVTAMCVFLFVFILSFLTDFFGDQIATPSKYSQVETLAIQNPSSPVATNAFAEDAVVSRASWSKVLLLGAFKNVDTPSQPYKFLYDGKKYPKIAAELPVYRRAGVLMNEEVVAKNMGNLKFGTLSLKNLPEMNIDALILQVKDADTYSLHIDIREGTIALVNNSLYELSEASDASESSAKVYDPKGLSKKIEKKLKGLGISLAGYGNIQIEHRLEENAVDFLSPFLLNGYTVWSPKNDQQLGVRGVYNPETDQISLSNIDIAKYEYATYSTRSQEEVMASLPTGWDYFDGGEKNEYAVGVKLAPPEVVYLVKWIGEEKVFVPAVRFLVNGTGIAEVNAIYRELVDF